jgi:peptidyl-prolyl cis-trans isomerase C
MASFLRAVPAAALVVGIGLIAAAQDPKTQPARKPQAKPAAPKAKAVTANPVLAEVNGEPIKASEFRELLSQFSIPPGREQAFYEQVMDYLVSRKLLAQFVKAQRIEAAQKDVEDELNKYRQIAQQNGTSLESELSDSNLTMEEFRQRIAEQQQLKKYVLLRATEAELRKYAETHKDVFNGAEVRASHILFSVDPDAPDAEKQQARAKAEAVKKEIDSGAISFADAANKYSDDPGNKQTPNGGDLDYFPRRGKFIEPFSAQAFGMKEGEVSGPVETEYGIHLIQVTDRREGRPYDFERDREGILNEYASDLQKQIVEDQRKQAKIDIKPMPAGLIPPQNPTPGEAPKAAAPKPAAPKPAAPKGATPKS